MTTWWPIEQKRLEAVLCAVTFARTRADELADEWPDEAAEWHDVAELVAREGGLITGPPGPAPVQPTSLFSRTEQQ